MRLLTLLAAVMLCAAPALSFLPNKASASSHGGFWAEITGHGGEVINGLVAHGDHLAFNHSLDTIRRTAENFGNDADVSRLLADMADLNMDYDTALKETDGNVLMDAHLRGHYTAVHTTHDMAAALLVRLTDIAPRNADIIAMRQNLQLNRTFYSTDALCGFEATAADGTLLSDQFWDTVESAPDQTHWEAAKNTNNAWFFPAFLASLFFLMCITIAPALLRQPRKHLAA